MVSVGIDLVEVKRIEKLMKNPRFFERVLGESEYSQLRKRGLKPQSVSINFCAKEAFSKALGTGIRVFALREVELIRDYLGRPSLKLSGKALKIAQERNLQFTVSATHTKEYASVVVIAQ